MMLCFLLGALAALQRALTSPILLEKDPVFAECRISKSGVTALLTYRHAGRIGSGDLFLEKLLQRWLAACQHWRTSSLEMV